MNSDLPTWLNEDQVSTQKQTNKKKWHCTIFMVPTKSQHLPWQRISVTMFIFSLNWRISIIFIFINPHQMSLADILTNLFICSTQAHLEAVEILKLARIHTLLAVVTVGQVSDPPYHCLEMFIGSSFMWGSSCWCQFLSKNNLHLRSQTSTALYHACTADRQMLQYFLQDSTFLKSPEQQMLISAHTDTCLVIANRSAFHCQQIWLSVLQRHINGCVHL